MELIRQLSADKGYLDGRYMAATFNLLRGRDLIWNYVTNNYLLGEDYPQFDLLLLERRHHQPAGRAGTESYLQQLYRDNRLVQPGAISIDGTPIDLRKVKMPTYVQAGREDHIAPPQSVWKITHHFTGPMRFVLAGSGHIAGVVNPPAAGQISILDQRGEGRHARRSSSPARPSTKGSWWPDWIDWIEGISAKKVPAKGGRVPGKGELEGDRGRARQLCEGALTGHARSLPELVPGDRRAQVHAPSRPGSDRAAGSAVHAQTGFPARAGARTRSKASAAARSAMSSASTPSSPCGLALLHIGTLLYTSEEYKSGRLLRVRR